jgi:hypothetical protein
MFWIRQIFEKNWEYTKVVLQLFPDFKNAYDSVTRTVLFNIITKFIIPMKLVRLIWVCLDKAYSVFQIGQNLSGIFPIKIGL